MNQYFLLPPSTVQLTRRVTLEQTDWKLVAQKSFSLTKCLGLELTYSFMKTITAMKKKQDTERKT